MSLRCSRTAFAGGRCSMRTIAGQPSSRSPARRPTRRSSSSARGRRGLDGATAGEPRRVARSRWAASAWRTPTPSSASSRRRGRQGPVLRRASARDARLDVLEVGARRRRGAAGADGRFRGNCPRHVWYGVPAALPPSVARVLVADGDAFFQRTLDNQAAAPRRRVPALLRRPRRRPRRGPALLPAAHAQCPGLDAPLERVEEGRASTRTAASSSARAAPRRIRTGRGGGGAGERPGALNLAVPHARGGRLRRTARRCGPRPQRPWATAMAASMRARAPGRAAAAAVRGTRVARARLRKHHAACGLARWVLIDCASALPRLRPGRGRPAAPRAAPDVPTARARARATARARRGASPPTAAASVAARSSREGTPRRGRGTAGNARTALQSPTSVATLVTPRPCATPATSRRRRTSPRARRRTRARAHDEAHVLGRRLAPRDGDDVRDVDVGVREVRRAQRRAAARVGRAGATQGERRAPASPTRASTALPGRGHADDVCARRARPPAPAAAAARPHLRGRRRSGCVRGRAAPRAGTTPRGLVSRGARRALAGAELRAEPAARRSSAARAAGRASPASRRAVPRSSASRAPAAARAAAPARTAAAARASPPSSSRRAAAQPPQRSPRTASWKRRPAAAASSARAAA